jgi:predicted RNase H-like nuclease (RuvC/YqgF family)
VYGIHNNFSPNYDCTVELENGDLNPVKELELTKLTNEQKQLATYIKKNNQVIYTLSNEQVKIIKVDFLHSQAEIEFYNGLTAVVGFKKLRKIEEGSDSMEEKEFKFKVGDVVLTQTKDTCNGWTVEVVKAFKDDLGAIGYKVKNGQGEYFFEEQELTYIIDNTLPVIDFSKESDSVEEYTNEELLDIFFGHYKNENDTYTVPKQLLLNIFKQFIEE